MQKPNEALLPETLETKEEKNALISGAHLENVFHATTRAHRSNVYLQCMHVQVCTLRRAHWHTKMPYKRMNSATC